MVSLGYLNEKMEQLNDWSLEDEAIIKDYEFGSFTEALKLVNKIGEIAERFHHYPTIVISCNKVRLKLTTHVERAVTDIDFTVAEAIDQLDKIPS